MVLFIIVQATIMPCWSHGRKHVEHFGNANESGVVGCALNCCAVAAYIEIWRHPIICSEFGNFRMQYQFVGVNCSLMSAMQHSYVFTVGNTSTLLRHAIMMQSALVSFRCFIFCGLFTAFAADSGTDRSWKTALDQAETILRKDCGEHCVEVPT